jgi:hypothetical protein
VLPSEGKPHSFSDRKGARGLNSVAHSDRQRSLALRRINHERIDRDKREVTQSEQRIAGLKAQFDSLLSSLHIDLEDIKVFLETRRDVGVEIAKWAETFVDLCGHAPTPAGM